MKFLKLFLAAQLLGSIAFTQIKINPIKNPSGLPIKPERTISINTNESSYLDVDISPDGSTILFTCLGELFSLPAQGGVATQLTRGLAINQCPIWSPDGKLIAYESDVTGFVGLHVTNLSGSFRKVLLKSPFTGSSKLKWFPDNKHVSYGRSVYHSTGAASRLPENIQGRILGFSLDGRFLYSQENISSDSTAFVKYDRSNGEKTRHMLNGQYYNNARISPDGNWLIYIKYAAIDRVWHVYTPADSLMAVDMKTGKEKLLAHLNIKFTTEFQDKQHYCFSKDSKYLYIGYEGKIHRIELETGKNDVIPFTANIKVDMGALDYHEFPVSVDSFSVKYIRSASKSPDGKHLIFSALNRVYKMALPNGKPKVLVDQPFGQFKPACSPDGRWISYVSWSDSEGGHVWRVPSEGGIPEQITTNPGLYMNPSWSHDGKMLVVVRYRNELGPVGLSTTGQVEIISVENNTVNIIANNVPFFSRPVFSESGKELLFTPKINDANDQMPIIVSKDLIDNSETRLAITSNNDFLSPFRSTLISPDRNYSVFMYNEDLYLAPMANIGGFPKIFDGKNPVQLIRFARGAFDPVWEKGGRVLSWIDGNKYCSIDPAKIMEAAIKLQPNSTLEGLPETKIIDVNITADHTFTIELKVSRLYGNGIIALKNARIITMHHEQVIENGTVIIKNGRVLNIGETNRIAIPKGAELIDLTGRTIMPGLVDVHSHGYPYPPDVFPQQSWQRLINFSYGVTTRRNPSSSIDEFGYNELTETGQVTGPRSFTVGHAVRPHYNLNSLSEAKTIVNNRTKSGATYIKQYGQNTRLQRQLLLQACKEAGVNMTNEKDDPLYCLGMMKDGSTGVEHNPGWGEVYDDVINLVAKSGTYLCPTLQPCFGFEEAKFYFRKRYGQDFLNKSARFIPDDYKKVLEKGIREYKRDTGFLQQSRISARIKHAGGKIVMGSHGEDQGIGAHWEIWALQMGGLTNYEALETATITAAEALGMQKDLGSIEVGKIADLIILDKNPLEDIHNTTSIKYVMKAGVLYESETLDQIWPNKVKCPEWRMKESITIIK